MSVKVSSAISVTAYRRKIVILQIEDQTGVGLDDLRQGVIRTLLPAQKAFENGKACQMMRPVALDHYQYPFMTENLSLAMLLTCEEIYSWSYVILWANKCYHKCHPIDLIEFKLYRESCLQAQMLLEVHYALSCTAQLSHKDQVFPTTGLRVWHYISKLQLKHSCYLFWHWKLQSSWLVLGIAPWVCARNAKNGLMTHDKQINVWILKLILLLL